VVVSTDQTVKNILKITVYKAFPRLNSGIFVDVTTKLPISSRIFSIVLAENPIKTTTGSYGF